MGWDLVINFPEDTEVTEETYSDYLLAFREDGIAKKRYTEGGTYPDLPWKDSALSVPVGTPAYPDLPKFGLKRIPGANPFYFTNTTDELEIGIPKLGQVGEPST